MADSGFQSSSSCCFVATSPQISQYFVRVAATALTDLVVVDLDSVDQTGHSEGSFINLDDWNFRGALALAAHNLQA